MKFSCDDSHQPHSRDHELNTMFLIVRITVLCLYLFFQIFTHSHQKITNTDSHYDKIKGVSNQWRTCAASLTFITIYILHVILFFAMIVFDAFLFIQGLFNVTFDISWIFPSTCDVCDGLFVQFVIHCHKPTQAWIFKWKLLSTIHYWRLLWSQSSSLFHCW